MEIVSRNFGERLRALIEAKRQSNGEFAAAYGIAESQLYNWLKREAPPLHKHWQKLADYFGCSVDHIAYGSPLNEEQSGDMRVEEPQAPYGLRPARTDDDHVGDADELLTKIRRRVTEIVTAAGGDPARLGWIWEQMEIHLRPPAHWPKVEPRAKAPLTGMLVPPAHPAQDQQRKSAHG